MNILYDQAVKAMNAAITKAQETRIPVSIVVVDSGGHLISLRG